MRKNLRLNLLVVSLIMYQDMKVIRDIWQRKSWMVLYVLLSVVAE